MFTVDKNTQPTYWYAYSGKVEERLGEASNDNEFAEYEKAYAHAEETKLANLQRQYNELDSRVTSVGRRIFAFRALWNSTVKTNLASYYKRLAESKAILDAGPKIAVTLLPDQIPVLGERLALGTVIYVVNTWHLSIERKIITSERISFYHFHPEGVAARYRLDNGNSYVDSTLNSSYSNVEYYLDKDQAVEHVRNLLADKLEALDKKLKDL